MNGFETYQDKKKEWRWRYKSSNGEIVGAATEGFKTESGAITNSEKLSAYLQKDVSSDECLRYALIGVSCSMVSTHTSMHFKNADQCIAYMLKTKRKVNIANGIEILKERIKAYLNSERSEIFYEKEYKEIEKDEEK